MKHAILALVTLALTMTVAQADSLNCRLVGYYNTPGLARRVAVAGNYAYVADEDSGLRVISVSDPAHPTEVGYDDPQAVVQDVVVAGDYAYVANADIGLRVLSVSDPAHPTEVGRCDTPGDAMSVVVAGDYAYVAGYYSGLRVISVSDPAHPAEVGYYNTPGLAHGVAVAGNYVYVADATAGLQICQYYGAGIEEGRQPMANGLRPSATVIRGVLMMGDRGPQAGYRAELLDASGRTVLDLAPGPNDVSRLAPGVYFVREVQSHAVRRMIVAK